MSPTHPRVSATRDTWFGKRKWLAILLAAAAIAALVLGLAVDRSGSEASTDRMIPLGSSATRISHDEFVKLREQRVSRSATRLAPRVTLRPKPIDHMYATAPLNIWQAPREAGKRLGLIKWGVKVAVTGQVVGRWAEVLLPQDSRQLARWVNADYLADTKPKPEPRPEERNSPSTSSDDAASQAATGVGGSCTNGTTVPAGVSASVVAIHQAVCANWPQITTYGTLRADSVDHSTGRAVDIMVSGAEAWAVAEFLRANYNNFGINYIIHARRIWSVDRAGEGWRSMEDRGSPTANHEDHVHVSVY